MQLVVSPADVARMYTEAPAGQGYPSAPHRFALGLLQLSDGTVPYFAVTARPSSLRSIPADDEMK